MLETVTGFLVLLAMLVVALFVLLFSAERLVAASEDIGLSLGVPPFILGLTILAVGTSLPELVTGLFAVHDGSGEIVTGTVLGSNIANILLILGFSAAYSREFEIDWDLLHGDIPVLFGSLMLMGFFVYPLSAVDMEHFRTATAQLADGQGTQSARSVVTVAEGVILVGGYLLYLYYYTQHGRNKPEAFNLDLPQAKPLTWRTPAWVVAGLIGVPIGAHYTVQAAVDIADVLLVGKEVVAASMISIGTSLPELVVSYSALRRRNYEMALGNITGSNIFNTFVVMGVPAIVAPWLGTRQLLPAGEDSILFLQMPYYAATVIVFLVIVLDKKLTRTEGLMILLAYVVFIAKLYGFF